jgi:hypothetical protein
MLLGGDNDAKLTLVALGAGHLLSPAAASTVYDLDRVIGTITITGAITTDGYVGVLPGSTCCLPAHILDWNVTVNGGTLSYTMFGPQSGSQNSFIGGLSAGSLTATPHALMWSAQADGGLFNIQTGVTGSVANATAIGFAGAGYGYFFAEIGSFGDQIDFTSGRQFVFATSAAPELSTWAMMILGFAGVGLMAYRRMAKPALTVA